MECSVDGCGSRVLARGWCGKHYEKWRRWGDPLGGKVRHPECIEEGCGRPVVGRGWCETHYARFVRSPARKAARERARADRQCAQCKSPISDFRRSRAVFCSRECKTAARVASGAHRESALRHYYKRAYGLAPEQVEELRAAGCAICGRASGVGRHGQLHIDHCHITGKVRGALCSECNTGLGKFKDDAALLRRAAEYLSA